MGVTRRGYYYSGAYAVEDAAWFASHYQTSVSPYLDLLKSHNPAHKVLLYKSGTDTYASGPDADAYRDCCAAAGLTPEAVYLHWAEPTQMRNGDGSIVNYAAGQRVQVYGSAQGAPRLLHGFLDHRPHLDFYQRYMQKRSAGDRLWDGLFLDNCSCKLYNEGSVLSGGHVEEAGEVISSPAFDAWHWAHLRDFLRVLQGEHFIAPNTSRDWSEDMVGCAQALVQEFVGNPYTDTFPSIPEVRRRHLATTAAGVELWTSASMKTGTLSLQEQQYGTLAFFLVVQADTSSHHIQNGNGPNVPGWPAMITSGAEAEVVHLLGNPTGEPELEPGSTGCYRRMYERGAVYVQLFKTGAPDHVFPRQSQMLYLGPDGSFTKPDPIRVRNGGGAILVRA